MTQRQYASDDDEEDIDDTLRMRRIYAQKRDRFMKEFFCREFFELAGVLLFSFLAAFFVDLLDFDKTFMILLTIAFSIKILANSMIFYARVIYVAFNTDADDDHHLRPWPVLLGYVTWLFSWTGILLVTWLWNRQDSWVGLSSSDSALSATLRLFLIVPHIAFGTGYNTVVASSVAAQSVCSAVILAGAILFMIVGSTVFAIIYENSKRNSNSSTVPAQKRKSRSIGTAARHHQHHYHQRRQLELAAAASTAAGGGSSMVFLQPPTMRLP